LVQEFVFQQESVFQQELVFQQERLKPDVLL